MVYGYLRVGYVFGKNARKIAAQDCLANPGTGISLNDDKFYLL